MKLDGAGVFVTGGGSGLGAAVARRLAAAGAGVVVFDRDGGSARDVARAIGATAAEGDVRDPEAVGAALALCPVTLRAAVNCAGIAAAGRILGRDGPLPLDAFETVVAVNLVGTFNVMRLAAARIAEAPPLEDGGRGAIVNLASIAAEDGQIGQAAYAASKGGVAALTLPAARDLARHGIRVNTVAPGMFDTPMMAGMPEEVRDGLEASVPFPQRLGRPEELAEAVQFCLEADYLNAAFIRLDGGVRMPPR